MPATMIVSYPEVLPALSRVSAGVEGSRYLLRQRHRGADICHLIGSDLKTRVMASGTAWADTCENQLPVKRG